MSKVTIKMIANCAGVSIGTVDRALNGRSRIKEETKEQVLQVAKELGYEPNKFASALRKNKRLKIAVILPLLPHYFMDELRNGAESACKELTNFGTEIDFIHSNTLNPIEQEKILNELNFKEYDGVAINAGGEQLKPIIDKIMETGIPVVTFNSDVKSSKRLFYVGENNYQSGRIAGELMGRMLGAQGRIAIFTGFKSADAHRARVAGFRDYLKEKCPKIEIVCVSEYHDSDTEAKQLIDDMYNKNYKLEGIFCASTPGLIGIGNYYLDKKKEEICLIGYDISKEIVELMQKGICAATLYQNPKRQAYEAITFLSNYLNGNWKPEHEAYFIKTQIVLSENLSDFDDTVNNRKFSGKI